MSILFYYLFILDFWWYMHLIMQFFWSQTKKLDLSSSLILILSLSLAWLINQAKLSRAQIFWHSYEHEFKYCFQACLKLKASLRIWFLLTRQVQTWAQVKLFSLESKKNFIIKYLYHQKSSKKKKNNILILSYF